MNNPALREEPRHRPAAVIPLPQESSILAWLEANGRLLPRDNQDQNYLDEEPEELNDLMGVDEGGYDEIDDDDDADIDIEEVL